MSEEIGSKNAPKRFVGEQLTVSVGTSDPSDTVEGDAWIRSDLAPEAQQLATFRIDIGGSIDSIPIYETGSSASGISEKIRVQLPSGVGFIPTGPTDSVSKDYLRVWNVANDIGGTNEVRGFHDQLSQTALVFDIQSVSTNSPITAGSDLIVDYTVENTSSTDGTDDIELRDFSDATVDTQTKTLTAGEQASDQLVWATQESDAGSGNVTVASSGTDLSAAVTIEEASAIPDSVVAQYDGTAASSVDPTWADETGNGNGLSAVGGPTLNGSINGTQGALPDGTDDGWTLDPFSQSLPVELFVVARLDDLNNRRDLISVPDSTDSDSLLYYDGSDTFNLFSGTVVDGPPADTDPHIFNVVWRSGSDELILDGTSEITTDAGNRTPDRLNLGFNAKQNNPWDGPIGEVLYSVSELSTSERDSVTQYLADKWGIAVS